MLETVESKLDTTSFVDVSSDIARFAAMGLLPTLLVDRSTGGNIIWASDAYAHLGPGFVATDEILPMAVTGEHDGLVRTRASKARDVQAAFTKTHAEVFTPMWVVRQMVDEADRAWDESHEDATWQDVLRSRWLEITCGEAPYLVGRYDAADGTPVSLENRVGILDRKLRLVSMHTTARKTWVKYAHMALKSIYGYEFQGDNLLIARVNVLATLEEFARAEGYELPKTTYQMFARTISWNLWQMDGLVDSVPDPNAMRAFDYLDPYGETMSFPGFDEWYVSAGNEVVSVEAQEGVTRALVRDWDRDEVVAFADLKWEGSSMRFDYVIGNPSRTVTSPRCLTDARLAA